MSGRKFKLLLAVYIAAALFVLLFPYRQPVYAHAYSAGYTTLSLEKSRTTMTFALDELSVIELTHGDTNDNGMLEQEEFDAVKDKLVEILKQNLTLKINGEPKTWERVNSVELDRKGDATKVFVTVTYPPVSASQPVSLTDSLYSRETSTNYVNLLTIQYGDRKSTAALSGDNRSWAMMLTEEDYAALKQDSNSSHDANPKETGQMRGNTAEHSASGWYSFFLLGMNHIVAGYDHLLFLLSLLVARQTFKQYATVITAFTIAHSLTLTLTVLGWIHIPANWVEPAIAFSICYVAADNMIRKKVSHRWMLTFAFGLVHGMGFADILQEMDIPRSELAADLASFNIGIEAVQLAIVVIALPLLGLLHRWRYSRQAVIAGSAAAVILGGIWFVERIV